MEKDFDDDFFDDENGFLDCPKCNRSYDDADFDFQICSKCGWDAEKNKYTTGKRRPSHNDYMSGEADILTGDFI